MQGFFGLERKKSEMNMNEIYVRLGCCLEPRLYTFLSWEFFSVIFVDFQFLFFLCRVECVNMFEEVWLIAHSSIQFFFSRISIRASQHRSQPTQKLRGDENWIIFSVCWILFRTLENIFIQFLIYSFFVKEFLLFYCMEFFSCKSFADMPIDSLSLSLLLNLR